MNDYTIMIDMLTRAGIEFRLSTHVDAETTTLHTDEGHAGIWILSGDDGGRQPLVIMGFDVNDCSLKRIDTEE